MRNIKCDMNRQSGQLSRRGFLGIGLALAGVGAALPASALADMSGGIAGLLGADEGESEAEEGEVAEGQPAAPAADGVFEELAVVDPTKGDTVVEIVDDSKLASDGILTVRVDNSISNKTFASFVLTVRVADAERFAIGDYECDFIERGSEFLFEGQIEERDIQIPWEEGAATYEIMSVKAELPDYGAMPFEIVEFGSYPQGPEGEIAPIQWYVIENREDGSRLLMSKYVLDAHAYFDDSSEHASWEDSAMRAWLNGEFLETAFSAEEAARIAESKNAPSTNVMYGTDSGYGTIDRVFLLGADELLDIFSIPATVFDGTGDATVDYSLLTSAPATPYAIAHGADDFTRSDVLFGDWALRTPGVEVGQVLDVYSTGTLYLDGSSGRSVLGVRPALVLLP